ncbi:MAG: hypothetical protein NT099_04435 [Candidatus Saganbacteria bacterium]|nr:hypothetical protein [Candidatus Saganbacteria bacterium]
MTETTRAVAYDGWSVRYRNVKAFSEIPRVVTLCGFASMRDIALKLLPKNPAEGTILGLLAKLPLLGISATSLDVKLLRRALRQGLLPEILLRNEEQRNSDSMAQAIIGRLTDRRQLTQTPEFRKLAGEVRANKFSGFLLLLQPGLEQRATRDRPSMGGASRELLDFSVNGCPSFGINNLVAAFSDLIRAAFPNQEKTLSERLSDPDKMIRCGAFAICELEHFLWAVFPRGMNKSLGMEFVGKLVANLTLPREKQFWLMDAVLRMELTLTFNAINQATNPTTIAREKQKAQTDYELEKIGLARGFGASENEIFDQVINPVMALRDGLMVAFFGDESPGTPDA